MRSFPIVIVPLATALLSMTGCTSNATKTESTVSGTVALATYPSNPSALVAADESGLMTAAGIGSDARFTFSLTKGHKYRLFVEGATPDGTLPVVFPRASGKLDTSFTIRSGGAIAELGLTRYAANGLAGFQVKTGSLAAGGSPHASVGEPRECVDGKVAGTGVICVDDDDKTSCEDGSEGSDDSDDRKCVNGMDAKTGAPCADPVEPGDDADASKPMAVPEKSPPNDIDGCDEQEDDDNEQDGEHED